MATDPPAPILFKDVADSGGLDFVLHHHPTADKHLIETMPGGVAVFDYDNDGLVDIYFTNGAAIPSLEKSSPQYWNRLYRNLGGMKFRDVTEAAGVAGSGYSMGAAAGDYDNDGHVDLFVAGVRANILFRNRGDGTFENATLKAGIPGGQWSVAAGWFDYDNDGRLDLFVVNYLDWSPAFNRYCGDRAGNVRVYCHPRFFPGLPNTLYRNRGDGAFEDVSRASGIGEHPGKGMSVAFADYDQDGCLDVFVTNDTLPNFLFRNLGGGKFEESGLQAGAALVDTGKPVSSMGTDFRDYNNDGLPDIAVTALSGETFPLFRHAGQGTFADATYSSRLAQASRKFSGWSIGLVDFNNDGWKDIFSANSHVNDRIEKFEASAYRQPNTVFANAGDGTFRDGSLVSGLGAARAHRGSGFADFNNDGRVDVVVSALGERAELWENASPGAGNWIALKPTGTRGNRDGIGTQIRIGAQHNMMTTGFGYASSSHAGVHFGLGAAKTIDEIDLRWPSGVRQVLKQVPANQVLKVREPPR